MKKKTADFCLTLALKDVYKPSTIPLKDNSSVRIGTSLTNDILINSPGISPRHAEIISGPEGFVLREPGENRERKLAPGQNLSLGNLTVSLESGKPRLSRPAAKISPGKSSPARLRVILFALIGLALVFLFFYPAPSPRTPPSLKEDSVPETKSSPSPGGEMSTLPPEQRISRARASLALGEQRLKDYRISIENLSLARAEFQKAMILLEGQSPAPDFLAALNGRLRQTESLLEEEFRRRKFSAEQAIRFQDPDRAELELKNIQKLLNVPDDPRYRYAQERLKEIGRAN
ncbi:MAG: FHA domain-containing protein [bacterium]|nr:FHA domain-containing protein [bacterium]